MNLKIICSNLQQTFHKTGVRGVFRTLGDRIEVRYFEYKYRIETEAVIELKELGIDNPECHEYGATDYRSFLKLLKSVAPLPAQEVFLDLGCGMGRTTVLAATFPFQRVIGVEISAKLSAIAEKNIGRARRRLRCPDVRVVTSDATAFAIPDDVTLVYIFNSFQGSVLERVLGNVQTSLARSPRRLQLIFRTGGHLRLDKDRLGQVGLPHCEEFPFSPLGFYQRFSTGFLT